MLLDTAESLAVESDVSENVCSECAIWVVALRFESRLYPGKIHRDDFVCMVHVQASRYPDKSLVPFTCFAKLFCEFWIFQTQRLGHLLSILVQRRGIDPFGIEKQRNGLHATSKLAPLAVQKLSTLWAGFD